MVMGTQGTATLLLKLYAQQSVTTNENEIISCVICDLRRAFVTLTLCDHKHVITECHAAAGFSPDGKQVVSYSRDASAGIFGDDSESDNAVRI